MAKRKNYKVLWSHAASRDLESTVEFISRDNVAAALQILNKLRKKAATLKTLPLRGRVVPELAEVVFICIAKSFLRPGELSTGFRIRMFT